MDQLYTKLNQCNIKAVALNLINPFAHQFTDQSRSVPIVSERSSSICYKLVLPILLFVASPRLTAEIRSFLLLVVSSYYSFR